jgi:hypothetical protein
MVEILADENFTFVTLLHNFSPWRHQGRHHFVITDRYIPEQREATNV